MTEEKQTDFKIRITHDEPIELKTMAVSLLSLQELMDSYISKEHGVTQSKIYLEKVEVGSDIYSLIFELPLEILPILAPVSALKEVIGLISAFKDLKDKSLKEIEANPHFTPQNANLLQDILAPVVINQNTYNISQGGKVLFGLSAEEARQIYANAQSISDKPKKEYKQFKEKVLLKMYKTTDTKNSKTRHTAKCEQISPYVLRVIFGDDAVANEILANPYGFFFLVDLTVYRSGENAEKIEFCSIDKIWNKVEREQ